MAALRLCLERIVPPRKSRTVEIDMPDISSSADTLAAMKAVVQSVAEGATAGDHSSSHRFPIYNCSR